MVSRARQLVFWPGESAELKRTREGCQECNRNAPSQAPPPPSNVCPVAATPFETNFAYFCEHRGHKYLVVGDRLSGWTEIYNAKRSTELSGAVALVACLMSLFATFGVGQELSSDRGWGRIQLVCDKGILDNVGCATSSLVCILPAIMQGGSSRKEAKRTLVANIGRNVSLMTNAEGNVRHLQQA